MAGQLQKSKVKAKKGAKKSFFEVSAPMTAAKIELYASNKEELIGKTVRLDLTKNLRGKSLELILRIKQNENNLSAEPEKIELSGNYIRKAMRKGIDYCEDSFEIKCRDCILRVKPILITRKRVSKIILKILRENAKKNIESYVKARTVKEVFSDTISNRIQKQLVTKLKKIYPLALCEIRVLEIRPDQ